MTVNFQGHYCPLGTERHHKRTGMTQEERKKCRWYASSFLFTAYMVMRQFLSKITLVAFADNYPNDRPLPKLQGMLMLNTQNLTVRGSGGWVFTWGWVFLGHKTHLENTPSFTGKLQGQWACFYCFQTSLFLIYTFIRKLLATLSLHFIKRISFKNRKGGVGEKWTSMRGNIAWE